MTLNTNVDRLFTDAEIDWLRQRGRYAEIADNRRAFAHPRPSLKLV